MLDSQRDAAVQIVRTASDGTADSDQGTDGLAWTWGAPQIRAGVWDADGTLRVLAEGPKRAAGILVGMWLNGSFMGETDASSGGWTPLEAVPPGSLPIRAGVVARARMPAGAWGVPWRTVVPDSPAAPTVGESAIDDPGGWVTVHLPAAGECDAQVRDSLSTTTVPIAQGGPSDVVPVAPGSVSVVTVVRGQDFDIGTKQHVDLYY